jgi:hypothetical protein
MKRIAVIGDIHGCYEEFQELVDALKWHSVDEIWTVGDLVDRGPSNAKTIDICLNNNIKSVCGNHEDSILSLKKRAVDGIIKIKNQEKQRTLDELEEKHWDYIKALPYLHIDDKLGLIIVHGGVWPKIPIYKQPVGVCRAQMIHPDKPGALRWWGKEAENSYGSKTEEQSKLEGWSRWYKLYDYKEDIIFGHSTFAQPMVYQPKNSGKCIGIDTGSCFGGSITACVYDSSGKFYFVSVKSKKVYFKDTKRSFWEVE